MIKSSKNKFGKDLYILFPGEYLVMKKEECVMASVTNSCIVVCLFDVKEKIAGMGHFILPGALGTDEITVDEIAKQGIADMEYIMGEIVKLGGDRKRLRATFFGSLLANEADPDQEKMVRENIRFLREYFTIENIRVVKENVSPSTQKILFFCPSGRVHRKDVDAKRDYTEFIRRENEYMQGLLQKKQQYGKVILFD